VAKQIEADGGRALAAGVTMTVTRAALPDIVVQGGTWW
jgi:hypothetical protein